MPKNTELEDPEKKLTRVDFNKGISFLMELSSNLADRDSIVFHSSTAKQLIRDKVKQFSKYDLPDEEGVTNDVDVWASIDTINSLIRFLSDKGIDYQVNRDSPRLEEGKDATNLTFNYIGVDFDFWSRDSVDEERVVELAIPHHDGGFFHVKVIDPTARGELYERLAKYDKDHNPNNVPKREAELK